MKMVESKKRMVPPTKPQFVDARKVRKITREPMRNVSMEIDSKPSVSFSHLPWDTVNIVFDYV
jgi:hypothetical protein